MKTRKIPMRMCVGCREMKEKKSLLRIVKNQQGEIAFDPIGKAPGRGAYICRSVECLKKAEKAHSLEKALETRIDASVYAALGEALNAEA